MTKVTIQLPEEAAKRLLEKWNARDPELLKAFEEFGGIVGVQPAAAEPELVIHYLSHGITPCAMPGVPKDWPPLHRWDNNWLTVTCPDCLKHQPKET